MQFLIIGGGFPDPLGKVGTECDSMLHERSDGTLCVIRQLAEHPTHGGLKLFFMPEHLMPLEPDPSIVTEDERPVDLIAH